MKKLLLFVLITVLCFSAFAMGAKEDADYSVLNPTNVKVAALKGPTAMGMVKLIVISINA